MYGNPSLHVWGVKDCGIVLTMVEQEGEITIHYGTQAMSMDLDDLKAEYLVEAFNLPFTPLTMYEKNDQSSTSGTKKLIPISKKGKFKVGHSYHIQKRESVPPKVPSVPPAAPQSIQDQPSLVKSGEAGDLVWDWRPLPEVAKNAVVLCRAVYAADDQEMDNYLLTNLKDHNFEKILRSRHGRSCFVVAEERDQERVYIAFCDSHMNDGWLDHVWAHQEPASQGASGLEGLVHSGFLERAMDFPMEKIFKDSDLLSKNIVFCGHSFGGAVAILATVMAMTNLEVNPSRTGGNRGLWIKCVTFGAPMVGDVDFRQFCQSHGLDRHIFNFAEEQDPIPHILSYCQILSAKLWRLQIDMVKERSKVHDHKAECETFSDLDRQKDQYIMLVNGMASIVEPALEVTSLAVPKCAEGVILAKGSSKVLEDAMMASKNHEADDQRMYTYLGNVLLSQNYSLTPRYAQYGAESATDELLENAFKRALRESGQDLSVYHGVHNYEHIMGQWARNVKSYSTTKQSTYKSASAEQIPRQIVFLNIFQPHIETGELVRVESHGKDCLRLRLVGRHLFEFVINKCTFNFGYPFATNPETFTCKKQMQADGTETLIFEERFKEDPYVSDFGTVIRMATKFGECEYLLRISQIRNVKIPTMEETLSSHESMAVLVKRAIQRGMAVAHLTRIHRPGKNSWKPINEEIIKEVMHLGTHALNETDRNVLSDIFSDTSGRNQFILSNEQEFHKVQCICDQIQTFLRSPLELTAETTVLKKIGIVVTGLLGGVALAFAAGPGMVIIGMMEATSMSAAGLAGSFGFFSTGFMTNYFFTSSPVDKNYEIVLSWLTMELMKKCQKQANETRDPQELQMLQEVSDLREDGSLLNLEKASLLMYNPEIGIGNFVGCDIGNCTIDSQNLVIKRIECIRAIHAIRSLMAEQCYIGIVGMQDAGKTTLINKIWGVGGRTGNFSHTTVPVIYEVHKKVSVVDFPGSTSLDYHAKTFSICGAMNNLILVIVPFTGDINQGIAREISEVFSVMAESESSKVLLCINKSGYELPKAIREEMTTLKYPLARLKNQFASTLNQYYKSQESNFKVSEENILFTDWMVGDTPEMKDLGIVGVDGIKNEIRKYLIRQKIFHDSNTLNEEVFPPKNFQPGNIVLLSVQQFFAALYYLFVRLWIG